MVPCLKLCPWSVGTTRNWLDALTHQHTTGFIVPRLGLWQYYPPESQQPTTAGRPCEDTGKAYTPFSPWSTHRARSPWFDRQTGTGRRRLHSQSGDNSQCCRWKIRRCCLDIRRRSRSQLIDPGTTSARRPTPTKNGFEHTACNLHATARSALRTVRRRVCRSGNALPVLAMLMTGTRPLSDAPALVHEQLRAR